MNQKPIKLKAMNQRNRTTNGVKPINKTEQWTESKNPKRKPFSEVDGSRVERGDREPREADRESREADREPREADRRRVCWVERDGLRENRERRFERERIATLIFFPNENPSFLDHWAVHVQMVKPIGFGIYWTSTQLDSFIYWFNLVSPNGFGHGSPLDMTPIWHLWLEWLSNFVEVQKLQLLSGYKTRPEPIRY